MMFNLNEQSKSPKYEQLIEKIKELIFCKAIKTGEKMPSIRALSIEIGISPNTVQKSYHELEKIGYLYSVKGKGYFVAKVDKALIEVRVENELKPKFLSLLKQAKYLGLKYEDIIRWIDEIY